MQSTVLTLRFGGDDLCPQEVTDRLGQRPTLAHTRGEEIPSKAGTRIAKVGQWHLTMEADAPEDFGSLVLRLFGQLTSDCDVWCDLSRRYDGNLFAGLFMSSSNDGFSIDGEIVQAIERRGLTLHFDIYSPTDE